MGEPVDEEGAALNRRVELYLRGDRFEVPTRRKRSAIPRPPGEPPLEATPDGAPDDDDDDGTADADGDSQTHTVRLPKGEQVTISASMLHHLFANLGVAPNDYEDDMASEDDEGGVSFRLWTSISANGFTLNSMCAPGPDASARLWLPVGRV
jgi:hypothetical protein